VGDQKAAETAEKLSQRSEHLIGDAAIEIFSLGTTGKSFSVSAILFEAEVIPALNDRAGEARALVGRYDKVIAAAEKDLSVFNDARSAIAQFLWSDSNISEAQKESIQQLERKMSAQEVSMFWTQEQLVNEAKSHEATMNQWIPEGFHPLHR
jgi:hypothetical protein